MAFYQGDTIVNQPVRLFVVCPDCKDMHLLDMTVLGLANPSFYFICRNCGLHSWVRKGIATGFDIRALGAYPPEAPVLIENYSCDGDELDSMIRFQEMTNESRASRVETAEEASAAARKRLTSATCKV